MAVPTFGSDGRGYALWVRVDIEQAMGVPATLEKETSGASAKYGANKVEGVFKKPAYAGVVAICRPQPFQLPQHLTNRLCPGSLTPIRVFQETQRLLNLGILGVKFLSFEQFGASGLQISGTAVNQTDILL